MNYYSEIKNELINNEITKRIKDYSKNKSDLTTYYNVGKLLSEAGKHYGEGIINEYSKRLTNELGKGYGVSSLKNMRKLYELILKSQTVSDFLSYSHYVELMAIDNIDKIKYYIKVTEQQNLSVRELRARIKNYVKFVDKNIKRDDHNKTIGLLIVKKKSKYVIEYTTSDDILVTTYALNNK